MKRSFHIIGDTLWLFLPALIVLICVYTRVRLLDMPLERDEGGFAYLAQFLLKGIPPYTAAYSMQLPGLYGAYALCMILFGQTAHGIHLGLLLVNLVSIALVFLLGRRFYDLRTGAVSAGIFALLAVSRTVYGASAHATHFLVLFALAGFLCLYKAIDRGSRLLILSAGLLFGMSFTMKQHAAPIILFALCLLVWRGLKGKGRLRHTVGSALLFVGGIVIPFLGWALYLYLHGVFGKFWFWTVRYAAEYASGTSLEQAVRTFILQGGLLLKSTILLWLIAVVQFIRLLTGRERSEGRIFLVGLFVASFLAILPGFFFRPHYFVIMLPAVALLIGTAVTAPFRADSGMSFTGRAVTVILVIIACSAMLVAERTYFFSLTPSQVSREIYLANPFVESPAIAAYLKANTLPTDRIAILGSEPQILFYADRLSATGYIYMYGLMEEHPFSARMQEEVIREIEAAHPTYVVMVNIKASWLPRLHSDYAIFNWADRFLAQDYEIDGVVDLINPETTVILWGKEARGYTVHASNNILVYRSNNVRGN